jgi:antitoxin component of RelBE/YafQ-DinJ toxin-antitoxin module
MENNQKMATFRIEEDLWGLFNDYCMRNGLNKSAVIRLMIIKLIAGKVKLFDERYVDQP